MEFLFRTGKWINALIALIATLTSLYWSTVLGWIPCDFCWYERICMYPLALIYTVSLFKKSASREFTLPLAGIGIILSLYHYLLQVVPNISNQVSCNSIVSCAVPEFVIFGFITPPFFALLGFLTMFMVDLFAWLTNRKHCGGITYRDLHST